MTESYFEPYRRNTIGADAAIPTPFGEKPLVYADWTASGRLYAPIEKRLADDIGPVVGNTHTETNFTGTAMTLAYHRAHDIIKNHCNADSRDVIINAGFGMTAAVNKFQRILGLKIPEQFRNCLDLNVKCRPVVFVTHMEHHSNQTSWLETIAEVVVIPPDNAGLVDFNSLEEKLKQYADRQFKIGAFTAASNVTGIQTPVSDLAMLMHQHGGFCFVDFAAAAPYVKIDMHPPDPQSQLDAVFFSPHKFLGGPGSSGVLIFNSELYTNKVPDQVGGGTVQWTNPWNLHRYVTDIEAREDGGTPGFLQAMRAAMAIQLKEQMSIAAILKREEIINAKIFSGLKQIPHIHILAEPHTRRLGIFSFYVDNLHYNLIVRLLNDHFGIQVRGGCSCAGTYGHYLLHVDPRRSKEITDQIDHGDLSHKPGWVRLSIHPTMPDAEIDFMLEALEACVKHGEAWGRDYDYDPHTNEYTHKKSPDVLRAKIESWYQF